MRILYKFLLSFFAIVLIIGITSFIAVRETHLALRKEIGETVVSMTVQLVSKYLRDMVARSNMDFEKMDNVQGFIDEKDHEWISVPHGTIAPFMQKLLENDLSDTLRKKMEFYNNEYNYKVYGEVFVTNKFGANVAQTGKTSDYKQDDEEWWQSAKRDNFYMKDIAYDESAGVHSTDISLKIDDEKGNFIGVVKVDLNIEDTFQYMRQSAVSERYRDVKFILTTKQGKNIYSSRGDKLLVDYSKDDFFTAADGDMGFLDLSGGKTGQYGDLFSYARSKC